MDEEELKRRIKEELDNPMIEITVKGDFYYRDVEDVVKVEVDADSIDELIEKEKIIRNIVQEMEDEDDMYFTYTERREG